MVEQTVEKTNTVQAKPILKWAGGKTQMLNDLLPKVPSSYGRYIEPFFGGGAMFFALQPENAIIADSNPELINMYRQVAANVDEVIQYLKKYENTSEMFYTVREQEWTQLPKAEAAARTIFLNRTCFNGLYRVNKQGKFNVPYGKYANPKICDEDGLKAASEALKKAEILCGDYLLVLDHYAQPGDFVFLDPPYLPISEYADFKRYTKEQFYEEDHIELAKIIMRLQERGCHIILTNSNHPLVHELYAPFTIDVIQTKRHISCNGSTRKGEDVIVTIPPKQQTLVKLDPQPMPQQVSAYPPTRFMGSKSKLLSEIWSVVSQFNVNTVVDLFSGSGVVGYMLKAQGKAVISNDYMAMSATFTKAMVENNSVTLPLDEAKTLLIAHKESDHFVADTFKGLYYSDEENDLIDTLRTNIAAMKDQYKQAIAMTALIRACTKKRPRGIFTYTGHRYDDGRQDLKKSLSQQFLEAVEAVNKAVFDNGKINLSKHGDAMDLKVENADLVYIDPPYYSPLSDNEYVRRYHFVEGLARDWKGVEIQEHTQTKKFKSYPTPFSTRKGAADAFDKLFKKFANSILVVSYSSNSQPTQDEMVAIMAKYKEHVEVIPIDYKYSFGNQSEAKTHRNSVQEYLFVGY
ncbi:Dam family site-specific DNA-(adenine-N6)-methyltransferase [Intestinimonas butyriciproducens]|uniref:Dam family site-specific DNA-(adenine-N6)-methyltransferase n=1 Tax=Intestinimonas butyriciproducens TaxID=1297617 RepID=UPI00232BC12B|nr:Dam family site-specific DNA-(adenine-N6)-methyltransferase [Intestinimonas butyriciproducens]MDB7860204.1 Dam family site-specific DNA-(adenine-N6)-methyltransferase [Intestinimonas butyriciproducens]MDB7862676.1 Dam family site-specific DNA-(adenine-N6)-methyltransferase [Intestinimonas butyriciproducens]